MGSGGLGRRWVRVSWSAATGLVVAGCGPDPGEREGRLRSVLEAERAAHMEVDALALASLVADTLLAVEDGEILTRTREQVARQFEAYFDGASYAAWDDVEPPRIQLARGGERAVVHRRIRVDRSEPAIGRAERRIQFESAWTATYAWQGGGWLMTSVTSTFPPGPDEVGQVVRGARRAVGLEILPPDSVLRAEVDARGPDGPFQVTVHSSTAGEAALAFEGGPTLMAFRGGGWMEPPEDERRPLTLEELSFLRGHEVHLMLLDPSTRLDGLVALGRTTVAGDSVLWLRGRDVLDQPVDLYYHSRDTVPAGFTVTDPMNPGAPPVLVTAGPWVDDRGGPALTRTVTLQQGHELFEYRYRELGWVPREAAQYFANASSR